MNYSLIRVCSTADGPGLRVSVYFSGCQLAMEGHACKGCHNSKAWDPRSGKKWDADSENKVLRSLSKSYISGLSVLGGEPLSDFNIDGVIDLVKKCKEEFGSTKDIWLWTGYNLDDRINEPKVQQLLSYVDMVVDGPFEEDKHLINLKFRGSTNQRVLKIEKGNKVNSYIDFTGRI